MHFADYAVIAAYFGIVLLMGIWLRGKVQTSEDFFLSGRSLPLWITAIAYLSANLGSLELMGAVANGAKYGVFTSQLYWIGSVPAMIFAGLVMTPLFYRSRVRSIPEYLRLRFDERTRTLNAAGFAILTVLTSGINLYGLAIVFHAVFQWSVDVSILAAASTVLCYVTWGGLRASIYTEVLQFFLIVVGLFPLAVIAYRAVGGASGFKQHLPENMLYAWRPVIHPAGTPYGGGLFSVIVGLGFVVSFAYWSTDFLVMQRAFAARDIESAKKTPVIAAFGKALFPFLTVIPGLAAVLLIPAAIHGNYNLILPMMILRYYPVGLVGLGMTALVASFMAGMAGNVTAFNTVWTYDLYQTYFAPGRSDRHYLLVGRISTVAGVLISVGAAYMALQFDNVFEYWALLSSIFIGSGFATFILGIFVPWITGSGAFWGMLAGYAVATANYLLFRNGVIHYGSMMHMDFLGGTWGFMANCLVATVGSFWGQRKSAKELDGLVFRFQAHDKSDGKWWQPGAGTLALVVAALTIALNILFR